MSGGPHDIDDGNDNSEPAKLAETGQYNPAKDREKIRGVIAVLMTALFIVVLLAGVIFGWVSDGRLEKLAGVLIAPVSGLLGAVAGFYYGEQSHAG